MTDNLTDYCTLYYCTLCSRYGQETAGDCVRVLDTGPAVVCGECAAQIDHYDCAVCCDSGCTECSSAGVPA